MARTNPNGANQYKLDPRQKLFSDYYFDPESETFSNATKSALKAGYAEWYSTDIISRLPEWLKKKVEEFNRETMLKKAERNINKFLDKDDDDKSQLEMTKFVASTIGKQHYSTKEADNANKGGTFILKWAGVDGEAETTSDKS